ncbi:MAG: twin-arginine translocation signal domain-containing protein [Planctomycetes bacterium]|nr:twin-arginine translocation signal domain-containing protein [Planctomycetota bacterium]
MCEHCTRRDFLGAAAAMGGMAWVASRVASGAEPAAAPPPPPPPSKVRICAMVAGAPANRSWGTPAATIERVKKRLIDAEKNLGNIEFVVGQAGNAEEAARLLAKAGPDAPVLAISASIFGLSAVMPVVFQQRRPAAVFHLPVIGGHDWCLVPRWLEDGHRVTLFNTTDFGDLERAAALLRVVPLLKQSRVLVSPPFKGTPESFDPAKVKERLGVELVAIPDGRYDEVLAGVDAAAAEADAARWIDRAMQVVEPTREDVVKAARAGQALHRLIDQSRVQALCVGTCMGWLARGFPCLGFSQLNGRGIPAACDGDADCVLTMLTMQHAFQRAGFLGNAGGVDMARNCFHLSHCSAPLKMEGPDGPEAPYRLRRHAELRGGAVPEVHYPIGQKLTFTKLIHLESLLVFTGKIIQVPDVPPGTERGCRTELVAEISDATKLLYNWGGGALGASGKDYYASLHRVAYYGDRTADLRHLAHLMGLRLVEEV